MPDPGGGLTAAGRRDILEEADVYHIMDEVIVYERVRNAWNRKSRMD